MNLPQNFGPAMLITLFAGLSTAIGGAIAFIVKKDNLKALSIGLGFSAGVMIFVSFMDMVPEAEKLLAANFPHTSQWLAYAGFIIGLIVAILIDYFLPDHIDTDDVLHPDEPARRDYKIKRAGLFTAIAICVHNFPEGMATFFTTTQNITWVCQLGLLLPFIISLKGLRLLYLCTMLLGKNVMRCFMQLCRELVNLLVHSSECLSLGYYFHLL